MYNDVNILLELLEYSENDNERMLLENEIKEILPHEKERV